MKYLILELAPKSYDIAKLNADLEILITMTSSDTILEAINCFNSGHVVRMCNINEITHNSIMGSILLETQNLCDIEEKYPEFLV